MTTDSNGHRLIPGQIYSCKIMHVKDGETQIVLLKAVDEDDVQWRTADDNSEFNEMSWDVIECEPV